MSVSSRTSAGPGKSTRKSTGNSSGKSTGGGTSSALAKRWDRLHEGDCEPYPDTALVARLAKKHTAFASWVAAHGGAAVAAAAVQDAWHEFHAGEFIKAIEIGDKWGALGATVANKAASIYSLCADRSEARALKLLKASVARAQRAVEMLPDYANAHYTLALAEGRYSQHTSILQALADGVAGRVRSALERTLELEPRHAEAHVALGLLHAEIISKLGSLVARFTYQVSEQEAVQHFRRAIRLAPRSPIAHMEYAHGLLLLDAAGKRQEALELYAKAADLDPADEMERLDVERAKRGLA